MNIFPTGEMLWHNECLSVVSKAYVWRQAAVDFFMQTDVVAAVDEKGERRCHLAWEVESLVDEEMGMVGFGEAQGIDYQ